MLNRIFNMENKFWLFANKMADVVILELAWLITSLPLITVGAASAAFWHMLLQMAEDQEGRLLRGYFRAFRRNFRLGTKLWLLQLGIGLLFGVDILFCIRGNNGWPAFLLGVFAVLALLWMLASAFLYPLAGRFDFTFRKIVSNSFFLALRHPPHAFCILLAPVMALAGSYFIPYAIIFLPPLALYLDAVMYNWIFSQYMAKDEAGEKDDE